VNRPTPRTVPGKERLSIKGNLAVKGKLVGKRPAGKAGGPARPGAVKRSVVSLDVGSSGVRAAQFSWRGRRCRLDRFAAVPLPDGAVTAGVVTDPAALARALKELWAAGKFTTKRVVFGLANDRILVRQLDLDWMEPQDFRKALSYSVADQIPMSVDEANLDFHVLEEIPASAELGLERTLRILLVAAGRDMVEGFVTAITEAGLQPVKAELAPFALIRAACPEGAPEMAEGCAEAIVDIGAETLTVVVHAGGQPRFVRTVGKLGGKVITGELQQKFGWSYEEAEAAKAQYGLPRPRPVGGPDIPGQRPGGPELVALEHPAQQVMAERATAVVAEVRTTLNFFLSASTGITKLSRVVLTGGGSCLPGLAERVAEGLKVEVATLAAPPDMRLEIPVAAVAAAAPVPVGVGSGFADSSGAVPAAAPAGAAPAAPTAPASAATAGQAHTTGLALLAGLALGMA
jgi:type IV pilus assembly protein PilM